MLFGTKYTGTSVHTKAHILICNKDYMNEYNQWISFSNQISNTTINMIVIIIMNIAEQNTKRSTIKSNNCLQIDSIIHQVIQR